MNKWVVGSVTRQSRKFFFLFQGGLFLGFFEFFLCLEYLFPYHFSLYPLSTDHLPKSLQRLSKFSLSEKILLNHRAWLYGICMYFLHLYYIVLYYIVILYIYIYIVCIHIKRYIILCQTLRLKTIYSEKNALDGHVGNLKNFSKEIS